MTPSTATVTSGPRTRRRMLPRLAIYVFLTLMALLWLLPLAWAIYTALRPFSDTQLNGYISLPRSLTLDNFLTAWSQGDFALHFASTVFPVLTFPGATCQLGLSSGGLPYAPQ